MIQLAYYHEVTNSLVYNTISVWLNKRGLKNLSDYFAKWASEEIGHSEKVKSLMMSLDIPLIAGKSETSEYLLDSSLIKFVEVSVDREDKTTALYKMISAMALDMNELGSAMLLSFSQDMSKEQIEETDNVMTLYAQILNLGENWAMAQLFDASFK
jgi:ferritin